MGLSPLLGRDELVVDGETYHLLDQAGERRWQTQQVFTQPGDALAKPYPLVASGGFGASQRHMLATGQPSDPTHHDYGENVNCTLESVLMPSQRITYLDLSSKASAQSAGFRIGGYPNSIIGGGGTPPFPYTFPIDFEDTVPSGAIGGGTPIDVPQQIIEYGQALYILCGSRTLVVEPDADTPSVVEGHDHGYAARARSGDVFNGRLAVALGDNIEAEVATVPYTSAAGTAWSTASGVSMSVYRRGSAGRLFSSQGGKVFNLLPGTDPTVAANYLPSNGEVISDPSDPVRALIEYASALVAGTARTARTLDPDRGFESVALIAESRLSASEYDGRAMISNGPLLFHATSQGVNLLSTNAPPVPIGPEELENNDSPFKGGEPGRPDYTGRFIAWPYYYPATGDSVIFLMRRRRQGEPGTGAYVWYDHLYLEGRECRAAYFWGGSSDRGPRLFFGAGTSANPLQVGWIDWDESDAQPALSSTLYFPMDDFGQPGVTLECERIEMPNVEGVDANNSLQWACKPLGGSFINVGSPVTSTGFQQVFASTGNTPSGKALQFRLGFTHAEAATAFAKVRGNPMAYIAARPEKTKQHTVLFDVKSQQFEDAEEIVDRLGALIGEKKQLSGEPGGDSPWIRIESVQSTEVEVRSGGGNKADRRLVVQLTFREVATS